MSSGKVGEAATVSKEGIVTSSEYSLGSEINMKSTRKAYGKVITTFQPTIEYRSPEPTKCALFRFRPCRWRYIPADGNFNPSPKIWDKRRICRFGLGKQRWNRNQLGFHTRRFRQRCEATSTAQIDLSDRVTPLPPENANLSFTYIV